MIPDDQTLLVFAYSYEQFNFIESYLSHNYKCRYIAQEDDLLVVNLFKVQFLFLDGWKKNENYNKFFIHRLNYLVTIKEKK